jgi:hypothetical protein
MALSPELKLMVSGAQALHTDPLEAKRAEILAEQANADCELALLCNGEYEPSIRDRLARLGLARATKQELREIVLRAWGAEDLSN